jgi:hypothetical protein
MNQILPNSDRATERPVCIRNVAREGRRTQGQGSKHRPLGVREYHTPLAIFWRLASVRLICALRVIGSGVAAMISSAAREVTSSPRRPLTQSFQQSRATSRHRDSVAPRRRLATASLAKAIRGGPCEQHERRCSIKITPQFFLNLAQIANRVKSERASVSAGP